MTVKNRFVRTLCRVADRLLRTQRYRMLRAHLWNDAVLELQCGGRCG
jgi:hypothetical protein